MDASTVLEAICSSKARKIMTNVQVIELRIVFKLILERAVFGMTVYIKSGVDVKGNFFSLQMQ